MKPFMLIFAFLSVCFFAQASSNDSIVKVLSVDTASYLLKNNIVEEEQSTIDTSTEDTFRSEDYAFDGWYNGEEFVSAEATYTFTVTSDINYTARFNEEAGETPTTYAIHIVTVDTNGNPLANNGTRQT